MHLPGPPTLKTTIIQLNKDMDPEDNNYTILTNEYADDELALGSSEMAQSSLSENLPKKKRRRSSSFVDDEELARRRTENKQLHSIIEKRRRIKINREFEALKYLIPACRNTGTQKKGFQPTTNNANKIDGMYKLTILKVSVEYILYLHHIVQKQHELLSRIPNLDYDYDVNFSRIPLDVNMYRNIDRDFSFAELSDDLPTGTPHTQYATGPRIPSIKEDEVLMEQTPHIIKPGSHPESIMLSSQRQLPTPGLTPDMAPILAMLGKHNPDGSRQLLRQPLLTSTLIDPSKLNSHELESLNKAFLFSSSGAISGLTSAGTSPFSLPIKSSVRKSSFILPDPALPSKSPSSSPTSGSDSPNLGAPPRKMYFKNKVPATNMIANVGLGENDLEEEMDEGLKLEDASKTLLALRKPCIERLLN
ncbi:hypothetical protein PUMCH_001181 [Australozyma saopauloensis]|uniref:BHLH domain-containing protein n=1 Tax=Australozyma saopauloensis TaxID=291208 RepID=A0AAX4H6S5_9ASCO|nr:hypothetical protein PUMCH_001181 [[Candida] saopauloensis]